MCECLKYMELTMLYLLDNLHYKVVKKGLIAFVLPPLLQAFSFILSY